MGNTLKDLLRYPFDGAAIMRKRRRLRKALQEDGQGRIEKRIAVLGGSTTEKIVELLELFLLDEGITPLFYQCDYARFRETALFDLADLKDFNPDVIVIHTTVRNLSIMLSWTPELSKLDGLLEHDQEVFKQVWDSLSREFNCPIIQNNFERPVYRMLGNSDISDKRGMSSYVLRMNEFLYEYVRNHDNVFVHDIEYLSAEIGLREWHDIDSWCLYKSAFGIAYTPEFAYSLSRIIKALFGKNKKVVVLDLDNTLWAGVVGDDGVEGIEMGNDTTVGEKFNYFQGFLKHLPKIGVVLAVNSKNDMSNALAGLSHEDCLLCPDDFASIQANWNPKSVNMGVLSEVLSLGTESFVFVDDNPAERDIVHINDDSITCLDFEEVDQVVRLIDDGGFFESVFLTEDDSKRARMYRENAARKTLEKSSGSYEEYLSAMEMRGEINGFDPQYISRIAQLTNKTNQFNLTTERYTKEEIASFAANDDYICLSFKLSDKYGDNGLISVILGECDGDCVHVRLWLMSCRVLKRGVERFALNALVLKAMNRNMSRIRGYYYPTKKNNMVKNLYSELGFSLVSEDKEGNSVWELELGSFDELDNHIEKV